MLSSYYITSIYLTHGHNDHSECIGELQEMLYPIPVYIHDADVHMIRKIVDKMKENGTPVGRFLFIDMQLTIFPLREGQKIVVGERVV